MDSSVLYKVLLDNITLMGYRNYNGETGFDIANRQIAEHNVKPMHPNQQEAQRGKGSAKERPSNHWISCMSRAIEKHG